MSDQAASGKGGGRRNNGGRRANGGNDRRAGTGGKNQQRSQTRDKRPPTSELSMDKQMVEYWAKSEDPALKERAEKMRLEHKELVEKQKQQQLDDDMKEYWKKAKVVEDTEVTAAPADAPKTE
ncbi:hypothetical protein BASA81_012745 [Batrachochytrium salamandrivorans]|nr:hypothetical protein BASA81_012745 [Batrachochytrium salamandrivorans]